MKPKTVFLCSRFDAEVTIEDCRKCWDRKVKPHKVARSSDECRAIWEEKKGAK
jgi:hypothetical protein